MGVRFLNDKETGDPRHTVVTIKGAAGMAQRVLFFNRVETELSRAKEAAFIVTASRNNYRNQVSLSLEGRDFDLYS